jgi:hypothetical protein
MKKPKWKLISCWFSGTVKGDTIRECTVPGADNPRIIRYKKPKEILVSLGEFRYNPRTGKPWATVREAREWVESLFFEDARNRAEGIVDSFSYEDD